MQFSEAILEYTFDCKIRKLSPKSIDNYRKQLLYLQRYLEQEHGVQELEEVHAYHIKEFLAMMDDKKRKPRYINDLLKVFRTFFNYMKAEGHIRTQPTAQIHNMKQPKVKIQTFTPNDIRNMLNYFSGRDYLSIRNKTILALMFDTGMRINEVITLCPDQLREDHILVHGKGNKERVVPVSAYLGKALMQYQLARDSYFDGKLPERYLFVSRSGKKLTHEGIAKFMKVAATEVGVNGSIRVSPHTCRHTFAHLQLRNGLDIYSLSRVMGHESISITQRYLEGIKDDQVLKAAQKTGVLQNL